MIFPGHEMNGMAKVFFLLSEPEWERLSQLFPVAHRAKLAESGVVLANYFVYRLSIFLASSGVATGRSNSLASLTVRSTNCALFLASSPFL